MSFAFIKKAYFLLGSSYECIPIRAPAAFAMQLMRQYELWNDDGKIFVM